jgi:hypothetical protein
MGDFKVIDVYHAGFPGGVYNANGSRNPAIFGLRKIAKLASIIE